MTRNRLFTPEPPPWRFHPDSLDAPCPHCVELGRIKESNGKLAMDLAAARERMEAAVQESVYWRRKASPREALVLRIVACCLTAVVVALVWALSRSAS